MKLRFTAALLAATALTSTLPGPSLASATRDARSETYSQALDAADRASADQRAAEQRFRSRPTDENLAELENSRGRQQIAVNYAKAAHNMAVSPIAAEQAKAEGRRAASRGGVPLTLTIALSVALTGALVAGFRAVRRRAS